MNEPKLTENMPRIRIAWKGKIGTSDNMSGHGEWMPESSRKNLMQWVSEMNTKFPGISHWIEDEARQPEPAI